MTARAMTEETTGTCDWGGCDGPTTAERLDPQSGDWLAVCKPHEGVQGRPSPGRAGCHYCGTEYALTVNGTLRLHARGWDRCPGSGQKPESTSTEETR